MNSSKDEGRNRQWQSEESNYCLISTGAFLRGSLLVCHLNVPSPLACSSSESFRSSSFEEDDCHQVCRPGLLVAWNYGRCNDC